MQFLSRLLLPCYLAAVIGSTAAAPMLPDADRTATGQVLHPQGRQVLLGGTMPQSVAMVPGRNLAVVVCSGTKQCIDVVDVTAGKLLSSLAMQADQGGRLVPTGSAFYGLAVAPDGKTVYVSEGSRDSIGIYSLSREGILSKTGALDDADPPPARSLITLPVIHRFPAGIALNGPGSRLYAADNEGDTLSVFDTATLKRLGRIRVGGYPFAVAAKPDGSRVYVASQRDGLVTVVDLQKMRKVTDIRTGRHPDALLLHPDRPLLFVANAESDTVSIVNTNSNKIVDARFVDFTAEDGVPAATPATQKATPTGLALSPDGFLYVPLGMANRVARVRTSKIAATPVQGYADTGWYPTAAAVSQDGKTLIVVNGKGSVARRSNGEGSQPAGPKPQNSTLGQFLGSVSLISLQSPTASVFRMPGSSGTNAVPAVKPPAAIKHVLYIIKENRTYDQVLGDVPDGNGDPSLVFFGANITPNQHALVHRFPLLDNFYACAEVSPDGWNWSTSGYANEYVERTAPELYGERKGSARPEVRDYDYEGMNRRQIPLNEHRDDVSESPGGYLWDAAKRAGISYRNYGCFLGVGGDIPTKAALRGVTSPNFASFDMRYADSDAWVQLGIPSPGEAAYGPAAVPSRYSGWKREFDGYVKDGNLPRLQIMRLPRDHTAATRPGWDAPRAAVADNDYAVGEIVDAISHSPYWKSTAIFILEDDAQSGADHVDCHRTTCYVISPYAQAETVDHRFYNTDSVLRTIELILGLKPMTAVDAHATPLACWTDKPDFTPYTAIMPDRAILAEKNGKTAYGASRSAKLDFIHPDAAPDAVVNEILWGALKGKHTPRPFR